MPNSSEHASPTGAALHVAGLAKRFGPTIALDGVDVVVAPGEVHAIIGENGAGKSTLMNVLAGAFRADAGTIRIAGRPYAPASPADARRSGIALIHQELSMCPHLSVMENVMLGAEVARHGVVDRDACRARTVQVLEQFGRPEVRPDRRVGELPVAAQQVVEICRALVANARILLMDEPTSSLPREDAARLFGLIRDLRTRGIAIVYISHFLEEVREVADRFTVLRDGRSVSRGRLTDVDDAQLIAQMVGRPIAGLFPVRAARASEGTAELPLLDVRDLAAPPAVRHASFELRRGEILGIAGLMGSGRTEMVRALFGLDAATAGTVVVRGANDARPAATPHARLRQGVGYLSEDRKGEGLALPLSIADNVTMTKLGSSARGGGWLDLRRQRAHAERWMRALGVKARSPAQPVRLLSGGNQQKVAIGRLLHQEADVLLLDEPTRGIDIGSKAQVYETIAQCADAGKAVLLVSSYLPELFGMCDRLAVMTRGRLSPTRAIDEWTPESVLRAAIGEAPC